jgi:RNA polymerase sigma-70 factor (ECF subfamily)
VRDTSDVATDAVGFDPADTVRMGRDVAALERFYRAHYDLVVGYLTRRVSDPHDVADLVADTFLAAMDSAESFDPRRGRTTQWVIGIAHNQLRHWQRRRSNHHRAVQRIVGRRLLDPDDVADLEERIDAQARHADVVGLLDGLPPAQRELIELVDVHGLTPGEAATALGTPPGLVRIRLHRARRALRDAYHREGNHP